MSISSPRSRSGRSIRTGAGFTLIELLVVSAIIVVITMLFLLRQSKYDSSTLLRSLSYSIALSVRQTQVYGTSVFGTTTSSGVTYAAAYGLHFSAAETGSYVLFADLNDNGKYDPGEVVQTFTLNPGYIISEVCALTATAKRCTGADDTSGAATASVLDVLFKRPNPDAHFTALKLDGTPVFSGDTYQSVYIQMRSADGTTRSVVVYTSGQVSVQPPNTAP